MIVSLKTRIAVREYMGGVGRWESLNKAIDQEKYLVVYAGEYLGKLNKQLLDNPETIA
jgi:hypothetical protein